MDSTMLSELPMVDPESDPVFQNPSLNPPTKGTWPMGKKTDRLPGQRSRYATPTKFANVRPDPLYYFEDGLRRVYPYYFTYNTFCKDRWKGRTLLDVFCTEFRDRSEEYYKSCIDAGLIQVMGIGKVQGAKPPRSGCDTIVTGNDMLSHTTHRHEPPVTDKPVKIVFEDDDLMVIDKPAGVPVHPTGRYNYNSLTEILKYERPDVTPMPCNRLDRLTSGLMFLAKNADAARSMTEQLRIRTVRKQYVARVRGEFPDGDQVCEQPILTISPKLGLNRVKADGKPAKTLFRKLYYNKEKNYTIVECHPFTGRTHQIRVHLQFMGHPIQNDPIYCNRRVWGENLGRGGEGEDEDIISRLNRMGKEEVAEAEEYMKEITTDYEKRKAEMLTGKVCELCDTPLYSDPGPHELGIFLHAKRYECMEGNWTYETELPDWALEGMEQKVEEGKDEDNANGKEHVQLEA